jgi:hypothetical protein
LANKLVAVLTTIQGPTSSVQRVARLLGSEGKMIVVGDRKGPVQFALAHAEFHSIDDQQKLPLKLAGQVPEGHYARKNLAYLLAMKEGAPCIYEFDDDNSPVENWVVRKLDVQAQPVERRDWVNVHRLFTNQKIWPCGFPLDRVLDAKTWQHSRSTPLAPKKAPIQQALSHGEADVDAIWRLTTGGEIHFDGGPSVWLSRGTWCPFNSQNTWWWPQAYTLMYLPTYCSFRMTSIWRSFVAQRCLWELNAGVVFHAADALHHHVNQDPMTGFVDEVPGYLFNSAMVDCLTKLELRGGDGQTEANLLRCYEELVAKEFIDAAELPLVKAWLEDCKSVISPAKQA